MQHWYTVLERPDWWLVIVGVLTAAVIAWQSFETRRAAQAMRDSNQATARSQRARLSIREEHEDKTRGGQTERVFYLTATNFGNTIAEVFEIARKSASYGPDLLKNLEGLALPDPDPIKLREPHMISPGESWKFAEVQRWEIAEPGMEDEVAAGRQIPVYYGWIKFKDLAGQAHRRRFFYTYSKANQELVQLGPEGWNSEE